MTQRYFILDVNTFLKTICPINYPSAAWRSENVMGPVGRQLEIAILPPPNLYKSIIYIIHIYICKLYYSIILIIIDL